MHSHYGNQPLARFEEQECMSQVGCFFKFVVNLPHRWRKSHSHHGAVCRRPGLRPKLAYRDTPKWKKKKKKLDADEYFDPGNTVCSFALRLMWNHIWEPAGWSKETCGDIFESILGYVKLRSEAGLKDAERESEIKVAAFIDSLCYCTWAFMWFVSGGDHPIWSDFSIFHDTIFQALLQDDA